MKNIRPTTRPTIARPVSADKEQVIGLLGAERFAEIHDQLDIATSVIKDRFRHARFLEVKSTALRIAYLCDLLASDEELTG